MAKSRRNRRSLGRALALAIVLGLLISRIGWGLYVASTTPPAAPVVTPATGGQP